MYTIYADDICIYDPHSPSDLVKIINPKLILEDNSAGSCSLTLPPSNAGYSSITRLKSVIRVEEDGTEIFEGRVLSDEMDFWNNRKIFVEGELAYLNDSTQPQAEYHNLTPEGFLGTILSIHNSKVDISKRFTLGIVTVTDPNNSLYRYTNYEKTIEVINDKLIGRLGGHLRIRKVGGVRYLDYLADYPDTSTQTIEFGKNLVDFTKSWDASLYATVLLPLGEALEESSIEGLTEYLTVKSVNSGSPYVQNATAVTEFGWIEKVVHWDDVTTASALLSKATQYLTALQFDEMELELTAADLHNMDKDVSAFKLLSLVHCISKPHGMDRTFPITRIEIQLDSPESTEFKMGSKVSTSLTSANNKTSAAILQSIEQTKTTTLQQAQSRAAQLIDSATTGIITISQNNGKSDALYISDLADLSQATRYWVWNLNGLAHVKNGVPNVALTMDGVIMADRILAGVLGDLQSYNHWNMETGEFSANYGNIGGWTLSDGELFKDVTVSGTKYRFSLRPPSEVGNVFMISGLRYDSNESKWVSMWHIAADGSAHIPEITDNLMVDGRLTCGGGLEVITNAIFDGVTYHRSAIVFSGDNFVAKGRVEGTSTTDLHFGPGTDLNRYAMLGQRSGHWSFMPYTDTYLDLGLANYRWDNIYAQNGSIQTSDFNEKDDIYDLGYKAELLIDGLKPKAFKMKNGTSGRHHYGFVAQDVEKLMGDICLDPKDFAGFVKYQKTHPEKRYRQVKTDDGKMETEEYTVDIPDEEYGYGLRYEEFIAPLVKVVQDLKKRVLCLEGGEK